MSAEDKQEKQELDQAYNEAMGMEEPAATVEGEEDVETDEQRKADADVSGEAEDTGINDDTGGTSEEGEQESGDEDPEKAEDAGAKEPTREQELLAEIEKLQQKTLTYAGRVKKAEQLLAEKEGKKEINDIFTEDGELGKGFEELKEDYPEVAVLESVLKKQQEQIQAYQQELMSVDDKINQVAQRFEIDKARQYLNSRFPGYEEKIQDERFGQWLQNNAPPEDIPILLNSFDPEFVGSYLEAYDKATGNLTGKGRIPASPETTEAEKEQQRREKALQASLGVSTRTASLPVSEGSPGEDLNKILEDAYNEAMNT